MTKQLSDKQKTLLREGIQIAKEALKDIAKMNQILDEMEKNSK